MMSFNPAANVKGEDGRTKVTLYRNQPVPEMFASNPAHMMMSKLNYPDSDYYTMNCFDKKATADASLSPRKYTLSSFGPQDSDWGIFTP